MGTLSELGRSAVEYAERGFRVLPLQPADKVPAIEGGVKSAIAEPNQIREYWASHPKANVGWAMGPQGIDLDNPSWHCVAIDIDVDEDNDEDGWAFVRRWEREHGKLPETVSDVSGRGGGRLYYRTDGRTIANGVNKFLGVDIRSAGGYCVVAPSIHPNGRLYEWQNPPDEYEIAEADDNVYKLIEYVKSDANGGTGADNNDRKRVKFKVPQVITEGGRNDTLLKFGCQLQAAGWEDDAIYSFLVGVNNMSCKPPLSDKELGKIHQSVISYAKGVSTSKAKVIKESGGTASGGTFDWLSDKGAVLHDAFAEMLISEHHACYIDGMPAVWNGTHYNVGLDAVAKLMTDIHPPLKLTMQREVQHYLKLHAPEVPAAPPRYIAFRNGIVDVITGEKVDSSPGLVITNVIPHDWNPDANDELLENTLLQLASGDEDKLMNLYEVAGVCMYRSNTFSQCPVLLGSGANGKSTYITLLRNMLGVENTSSMDLNVIGDRFQAIRLMGKLANLGDDIGNEFVSGNNLEVFKKVSAGNRVSSDVKGTDAVEFTPYCTMIFSANEMPRLGDSTDGMMRRLFPIEFTARFTPDSDTFDPFIIEKLSNENAMSALINWALVGLENVIRNGRFTPNARTDEIREEIRKDSSSVAAWLDEYDKPLVGEVVSVVYKEYVDWCNENGIKYYVSNRKFSQQVRSITTLRSEPRYIDDHKSVRLFVKKA